MPLSKDPAREIRKLRAEIREHDRLYYGQNRPIVSDEEYDRLLERLRALEAENPELISSDSPTQRVGGSASNEFQPVPHAVPMLSLDNSYDAADIRAFDERVRKGLGRAPAAYAVEAKIDGVSLALTYLDGHLAVAATRGDGATGEDVTLNARTLRSIPLALSGKEFPHVLEIRGEVYLEKREFARINARLAAEGKEPFVNPRNCASGSLRQKDPKATAARGLRFLAHSFGRIAGAEPPPTHSGFLEACADWGFAVTEERRSCKDIEEVLAFYEAFKARIDHLPYEADGLVVKVDKREEQARLGMTARSPRWAIAFKYPGKQATTKVKGVVFSVGRTGAITPVAELEPVFLSGVTISSATLHNFEETQRLGVKVGDTVTIERAGEVIPKVVQVAVRAKGGKPIAPPKKCPSCGGPVEKEAELVAYRCSNPSCPAQLKRSLLHFASRDALDVEGLGEAAVDQLVDGGRVKDAADLFALTQDDLLGLELFAEKKAQNLLAQLEKAKTRPLSRLLLALGIRQVGEKTARDLAGHFRTLDALERASEDELTMVPEIGPVVAKSVRAFFDSPAVAALLKRLKKAGLRTDEPAPAAPAGALPLSGKTFVFTGELEAMPRADAEERVRALGAKAVGSVSKKTSFVVVGREPGSKAEKARELGVTTLDEASFLRLLAEAGAPA